MHFFSFSVVVINDCAIDMKEKWTCSSLTNMGTSLICHVACNMIHKHNAYEKILTTKVGSFRTQLNLKPCLSDINTMSVRTLSSFK